VTGDDALRAQGATRAGTFWKRYWPDLVAVSWLVLLVFVFLAPALKDGPSFGPADLGRGDSLLSALAHPPPAHNIINGDVIDQGVPWMVLDWRLVHHGELPLWNALSGNGMPQLLNFESAPLALPSLVAYLFPLSLAFLVSVAMKLLLAGTGAYLFCRLLGARASAACFGATTAMLSGSFAGWLGWSITGPYALAGWIAAGAVLCVRRERGAGPVVLLALALAFAIYGGFPESCVLLGGAFAVFFGVWGFLELRRAPRPRWKGPGRVLLGTAAGLLLSAPLWLPGISVLSGSARAGTHAATGLPLSMATLLLAQGYDGLPIHGSYFFGSWNYYETAAYVGVLALVACVVAVVTQWRRSVVAGAVLACLACLLVIYDLDSNAPIQRLVSNLGLGTVALQRALPIVGFLVGVLAALGLERLVASWHERRTLVGLWAGVSVVALALCLMWSQVASAHFAPGAATPYERPGMMLPSNAVLAGLRRASLLWPSACLALVLSAAVLLSVAARVRGRARHRHRAPAKGPGTVVALALCGAQSGFLVFAGVGINSYAPRSFPATKATATLARVVGGSLVGIDDGAGTCRPPSLVPPHCGVRAWRGVGFYPEMNLGYGIAELAIHDPTIPQAVFDGWPIAGSGRNLSGTNLFAPDIDSLALARRYGTAYVLVGPHLEVPAGMRTVAVLRNDGATLRLAKVPGVGRFSARGPDALVIASSHPGDARYDVFVRAPLGGELLARITDVPGWQASANGRSLVVRRAPGDLLSIQLPPHARRVVLTYAPSRLLLGELGALGSLVSLGTWAGLDALGRRRPRRARPWRSKRAGSLGRWPPEPPSSVQIPQRSTPSSSSTSVPSTRS
jgi:hypothetical protein